jgi:hypothetical protein
MEAGRAWWPARARSLPPAQHERALAGARLERYGGLTVLYLAGTPYEMGYQHGVLARHLIHDFRQAAYAYVTSMVQGAVHRLLPSWLVRPLLFHQAAAYWRTLPQELVLEMRGIADGAGFHPIEVLVSTAIWEMYLVSGCSEFAAAGPVTADGSLLHGYNYDLMHPDHALIQPYLAVLLYRPERGVPFVTVNTVGSVGANAGMNQAGISVAWDNTYLRDDKLTRDLDGTTVPFIITLRRLLQHARCLDEAIQTVTGTLPRPLGDIIIVGSADEGRAVALETAGGVHAVREMEDGVIWSTNCFQSPQLAAHDRRGDGRRLSEAEGWRRFPRSMAYRQLFADRQGRLTPPRAAGFLRDPYPREAEGFMHPNPAPRATICRDSTSWSLVMEPGTGCLWVSDTQLPGAQGRFFAFDLPGWQRRLDLDMEGTGYQSALRCARRFLERDWPGAWAALDESLDVDGHTAPLLMMQAVLQGVAREGGGAAETLRQVIDRWGRTAVGAVAQAWLDEAGELALAPVPFPSAIQPLIHLRPADGWEQRAVAAPVQAARTGARLDVAGG